MWMNTTGGNKMFNVETAIVMTVGGIVGAIITTQLWQMNWFKRENFKMQKTNIMAENRIKLKQLERELGLTKIKNPMPPESKPDMLGSLAPLLSKLDGDQLAGLAERFLPAQGEDVEEGGIGGMLLNFAQENPEMVEGLLKGVSGKLKDTGLDNAKGEY